MPNQKKKEIDPLNLLPKIMLYDWYRENLLKYEDAGEDFEDVYFIANKQTGLIKIGRTKSLYQRVRQIVTSCGTKDINVVLTITLEPGIDASAKYIEMALHKYFKSRRVIGEWFNLTIRDLIQARSFLWRLEGCHINDNVKEYLNGGQCWYMEW